MIHSIYLNNIDWIEKKIQEKLFSGFYWTFMNPYASSICHYSFTVAKSKSFFQFRWHFCCQCEDLLCMQTRINYQCRYFGNSWLMWSFVSKTYLTLTHILSTLLFYDFIYIFMPLELILNVCMYTKHTSWSCFFSSLCSTWLPRQFSLHIFYLILSRLVYLAGRVLSHSTSKWLWSFVQYFTIQISKAHRLKWQPWFVCSSITAEWAHKNNHISIVIWRRRSGNDLFALNYKQLNSFCLVYTW